MIFFSLIRLVQLPQWVVLVVLLYHLEQYGELKQLRAHEMVSNMVFNESSGDAILKCKYTILMNRRRAATSQVARPNSARAAGAGGSSNTMLRLYTDDSPGLRV